MSKAYNFRIMSETRKFSITDILNIMSLDLFPWRNPKRSTACNWQIYHKKLFFESTHRRGRDSVVMDAPYFSLKYHIGYHGKLICLYLFLTNAFTMIDFFDIRYQ